MTDNHFTILIGRFHLLHQFFHKRDVGFRLGVEAGKTFIRARINLESYIVCYYYFTAIVVKAIPVVGVVKQPYLLYFGIRDQYIVVALL